MKAVTRTLGLDRGCRSGAVPADGGWDGCPVECSDFDRETIALARPYTMTSVARLAGLIKAVRYVHRNHILGDIVECGVWRGGSMMAVARTLVGLHGTSRTLRLFDTFEGMTPPTDEDRDPLGRSARELLSTEGADGPVTARAALDAVQAAMTLTTYPTDRIRYVVGPVESTVPLEAPDRVALLRLDTDWYESTKHELTHLFPRLQPGGVIIIDDYGHWDGARKAVDEYFAHAGHPILLNALDYTGRIGVKLA